MPHAPALCAYTSPIRVSLARVPPVCTLAAVNISPALRRTQLPGAVDTFFAAHALTHSISRDTHTVWWHRAAAQHHTPHTRKTAVSVRHRHRTCATPTPSPKASDQRERCRVRQTPLRVYWSSVLLKPTPLTIVREELPHEDTGQMVPERRSAQQIAAREPQSGVAKTKHRSVGLEQGKAFHFGPSPEIGNHNLLYAFSGHL